MFRTVSWITIAEFTVTLNPAHIYGSIHEQPLLNNPFHPASGAAMHANSQGVDPKGTTISSWPQLLQQIRPPDQTP